MKPYRIRRVAATASTNDDARQAAEAGEAEGLVIHALKQSAGRGRHGRAWESPEGNLYCSIMLRPSCAPQNYGQYSFVAALALFEVVQEFLPDARVTLKWPNDVLAGGKKIGGILLESGDGYLAVGIGLNVLHHPDNALYPSASLCSLSTSSRKICEANLSGTQSDVPLGLGLKQSDCGDADWVPDKFSFSPQMRGEEKIFWNDVEILDAILDALLSRLHHWYDAMQKDGFTPIRAAWLERAQKGRMAVKLPDQTVEGDFIDIDQQGCLRLRLPDGAERVLATGDVFFGGR